MGYFLIGPQWLQLGDLNDRLAGAGYAGFEESFLSIGGGGHAIIGRWIVGGEGHGVVHREAQNGAFNTKIGGGWGAFNVGYVVWRPGDIFVYPKLGVGGGGYDLTFASREAVTFDDLLANPARESRVTMGGLLVDLGVGADWLIALGARRHHGRGGLVLGLRAGYLLMPLRSDWTLDEVEASGGPNVGIQGPYVRAAIGFGGLPE